MIGKDQTLDNLWLARAMYELGAVSFGDFTLGGSTVNSPVFINPKVVISNPTALRVAAKLMNQEVTLDGGAWLGRGVSVHAASCPNVLNLMFDPERRIDVEWDSDGDHAPYHTVRLTMQVEDRKGMLAEISARVSDINTNITNMEARTGDDQQARIDMTVEIKDVKHLERVIKSIKGVAGVLGVERTARV